MAREAKEARKELDPIEAVERREFASREEAIEAAKRAIDDHLKIVTAVGKDSPYAEGSLEDIRYWINKAKGSKQ